MAEASAPTLHDIPIGLSGTGVRRETDTMGEIAVPADRYWGAQTERSLQHFSIGEERMPDGVHQAYGYVKKAAAQVHAEAGRLPAAKAAAIVRAAEEAIAGRLDDHFPLYVWQTGSGTQTNMNINEVLANRAAQLLGGAVGDKRIVHPNDDVNMGQSSNDTFPTVMHVAAVLELEDHLLPRAKALQAAIASKAADWKDVVKIGRTHLQDAVPLTVGQEWSGYAAQIGAAVATAKASIPCLLELAIGGTAVGTGLNAPPGFGDAVAARIGVLTGRSFVSASNKFAAMGGLEAMVQAMSAVRGLAAVLIKIANDMRWLASGPRSGLGELRLPENEPGSSIMPGKVNPTQCEAMLMVGVQVMAADSAVAMAASMGNFELNTMRPLVIHNFLRSARMLGDACEKFRLYSVEGTELDRRRIEELVSRSLMLVTALTPVIGYDKAAKLAHQAHEEGATLRDVALRSGWIDAAKFDEIVDARNMV